MLFFSFNKIIIYFEIQQRYGTLYRDGLPLDNVVSWERGIDSFYSWLEDNFPEGVILVAHGAFASDAPQIVQGFQNSGWRDDQIEDNVVGFCDTLHAFNKNFEGILICEELIQ
jgi:hypothetical protein